MSTYNPIAETNNFIVLDKLRIDFSITLIKDILNYRLFRRYSNMYHLRNT